MDSLSSAPRFDLTALVSLKRISAASCAGTPLVLLFHNQYALDVVRSLQQSLRERHPLASQVLIASVVDMSAIPLLLRGVAETVMAAAYREASRQLPKGVDPADYVIILPDRQGSVYKQFEVRDGGKAPYRRRDRWPMAHLWAVLKRRSGRTVVGRAGAIDYDTPQLTTCSPAKPYTSATSIGNGR
jgi:hypothetical protein